MSVYTETRVTVDESYLRRLRNEITQANQKNRNWQQSLNRLEEAHNRRIEQLQNENKRAQQENQNVINTLESDIKDIEKNNTKRLNDLRKKACSSGLGIPESRLGPGPKPG